GLGEIARDFEQHALMRRDRPRRFLAEAFVEICDRRIQHAGDLVQTASRDAVDAAFVFVRLLIGHADHFGELLLGQTKHDPTLADARSDVIVYRRRGPPSLRLCHLVTYGCVARARPPAPQAYPAISVN